MIEIREHTDSPELDEELRIISSYVADVDDDDLAPLYLEYVRVGEFHLALEVLVAMGRVHPTIGDAIDARLPQASGVVDERVVDGYVDRVRGRSSG